MRVTILPIAELSASDRQDWCAHLADQTAYPGPCFHPDLFRHEGPVLSSLPLGDYPFLMGPRDFRWDLGAILLDAGDSLLSAHFGLRTRGVIHHWFPGFDPRFAHLKPGRLLIHEMVAQLPALNATILDFGPGGEPYKFAFSSDAFSLSSGGSELFSRFTLARRIRRRLYGGLRPIARHFKNRRVRP